MKKIALNAAEYGKRSSIHGLGYALDRTLSCPDRILWLMLTVGSLGLAGYMITTTLVDWQARQVVTTLKTLTSDIEGKTSMKVGTSNSSNLGVFRVRSGVPLHHHLRDRPAHGPGGQAALPRVHRLGGAQDWQTGRASQQRGEGKDKGYQPPQDIRPDTSVWLVM